MKNLIKTIALFSIALFFVACTDDTPQGFSKTGKAGSLSVTYSSDKPLVVGNNKIDVAISENGKAITNASKVELKIFMPEMPGMPYMEDVKLLAPSGEGYTGNINFSMGGTWQVKIFIEKDGKKYKHSSSVIL